MGLRFIVGEYNSNIKTIFPFRKDGLGTMIDFLQGKWLRHPLHPALVHIPTALWPAAFVFDLLSQITQENVFVQLSFYAMLLGLIVAILAIPTGIADWTDIGREKPAWKL